MNRRNFLAVLLASVAAPKLPRLIKPSRGVSYIVFEDVPLERFSGFESLSVALAAPEAIEIVSVRLGS